MKVKTPLLIALLDVTPAALTPRVGGQKTVS
jgi:hypothetical protein